MFQITFPCFRKHILINSNYQLRLYDSHFTIQVVSFTLYLSFQLHNTKPKYEVKLTLYQCIHFTFEQEQMTQFGFEYNHKLKIFNADPQDIQKFKQSIRCKVMFREIQLFYSPVDLLGKGGTSKVYQVVHKSTKQFYASKCIDKKLIQDEGEEAGLFNEIRIMASMNHEKIIGIEDVFIGDQTYYIILEYLQGSSLNELISRRQSSFSQDQIQLIIKQILEALSYIHSKGIMHRDLKPENIMFKEQSKLETLKLIDFGLSTFIDIDQFPFPKCGTPGYVAPEIANLKDLHQKYTSVCDVFSAGCIFFRLCTGKELFPGSDFHDILKINKKCNINLENLSIYRTPPEAVDLLQKMLKVNPQQRITAQEALNHEYFQKTFDTKKSKFQQPQQKNNPISQTTTFQTQNNEENYEQVEDEKNHYFKVPIMTIKKQQQNALMQMKQKKMKKYLTTDFHDPLDTQN